MRQTNPDAVVVTLRIDGRVGEGNRRGRDHQHRVGGRGDLDRAVLDLLREAAHEILPALASHRIEMAHHPLEMPLGRARIHDRHPQHPSPAEIRRGDPSRTRAVVAFAQLAVERVEPLVVHRIGDKAVQIERVRAQLKVATLIAREQGLEGHDELARGWRQLVLKKKSSGPTVGKPSRRSLELFFTACYDLDRFRADVGIAYTRRGRILMAIYIDDMRVVAYDQENPGLAMLWKLSQILQDGLGK